MDVARWKRTTPNMIKQEEREVTEKEVICGSVASVCVRSNCPRNHRSCLAALVGGGELVDRARLGLRLRIQPAVD